MGQTGTPREDELYSIADEYMDHGIYPVANQKNWDVGYNRINELLAIDPTHTHPVTGVVGAPHLYVFDKCSKFISEIEGYKWKKVRNHIAGHHSEEPMDGNDHHMDGLNGFLASRPMDIKWSAHQDRLVNDNDDFIIDEDYARTSHMGA